MSACIPIVDETDNILGYKDRDSVLLEDIYRVSAIWITNSMGEILLAQRAFSKKHDPGKWGPAVAGTVEKGETYEQNAIKELEEELGLKNQRLIKGPKLRRRGEHQYFCQWYLLTIDLPVGEFVFPEREVDQVKWFSREELKQESDANPDQFLLGVKEWMELFGQK